MLAIQALQQNGVMGGNDVGNGENKGRDSVITFFYGWMHRMTSGSVSIPILCNEGVVDGANMAIVSHYRQNYGHAFGGAGMSSGGRLNKGVCQVGVRPHSGMRV